MMPEYFVQTEENTGLIESKKVKNILYISYGLKLFSLIFVILCAVFLEYLYLIGFVFFYFVGIFLRQVVLERIGKFEYFFVRDRLIITKISNLGRVKNEVKMQIKDIFEIDDNNIKNIDKNEFCAIKEGMSIIKIGYFENTQKKFLYFTPSEYLLSLIRNKQNDLLG